MARCTKEEAQETRNRIVDAAREVFHRQGVAATSLTHVADEAGLTRGAIYWHFKNKEELIDALFDRIHQPKRACMAHLADEREADPLGGLRASMVSALQDAAGNRETRQTLDILFNKFEMVDPSEPRMVRWRENFAGSMTLIEQALRNAVARGQLPEKVDVRFGAIVLHAVMIGAMQDWLFAPERFDLAREAGRLIDAGIEALRCAPAAHTDAGQ